MAEQSEVPIPLSYFISAYFENYSKEKGLPAWKRLQWEINNAYRPRFLTEVDKEIKSRGVESALELVYAA